GPSSPASPLPGSADEGDRSDLPLHRHPDSQGTSASDPAKGLERAVAASADARRRLDSHHAGCFGRLLARGREPAPPADPAGGAAGPTLMALFSVAQGALVSGGTGLRSYLRAVRETALPSTAHSLIPALSLVSLAAAADVYERTSSAFMLVSLSTAIVATILSVAGFVVVLPLAVARPQLR